jgi:hypothetical protein
MFVVLGSFDPVMKCGECRILANHEVRCRVHVRRTKWLASGRSTSKLLSLFRTDIVRQRVADMCVGTLAEKKQRYEVCLQRANCRFTLEGKPYGFRPVFLRLNRVWMSPFSAGRDCMDLVLDFLLVLDFHSSFATTTRLEFELLHLPARHRRRQHREWRLVEPSVSRG